MKKSTTKLAVLLIVAAFIATGMCAVPIVNVDCGGPEPAMMTVYGFNLMGFSAWGIIPICVGAFLKNIKNRTNV